MLFYVIFLTYKYMTEMVLNTKKHFTIVHAYNKHVMILQRP